MQQAGNDIADFLAAALFELIVENVKTNEYSKQPVRDTPHGGQRPAVGSGVPEVYKPLPVQQVPAFSGSAML